jgi:hypothetical protein
VTVSSVDPWSPSPAHFRAIVLGVLGVAAALLFRVPDLLVLATPFAVIAVWAAATRPDDAPVVTGQISPRTIREGEAMTWAADLSDVSGVDHVVAFAPSRQWLEMRPRSGVVAASVGRGDLTTAVAVAMRCTHWGRHEIGPVGRQLMGGVPLEGAPRRLPGDDTSPPRGV